MGKRRVMMFAGAAAVVGAIGAGGIATAGGGHQHFLVSLRGAQEVPPADPDGRATARLDIDTTSGEICWDLHFTRIATPTMAHIHNEVRGKNGPIKVFFFGDAAHPMPDPDELERGRADGCNMEDPALAADIAANPANYYVNIHNARFPAGAVRGQIR